MDFCTKCGKKLQTGTKYCTNCGAQVIQSKKSKLVRKDRSENHFPKIGENEIKKLNEKIKLQNNQTGIVKRAWYSAVLFLLIIVLAFMDLEYLPIHPSIVMISIFFFIASLVIGLMFRSREKKLQSLITGENLLASWALNKEQKEQYVNYLFEHEKGKNFAILLVITVVAVVVFGLFILIIDEGKLAMFFVLIALLSILSFFAFVMPSYYKYQNSKNDGIVLIGAKYAYINGYFHNWDFVLSGLSKVKVMKTPFYGINLVYYYTDRTLKNSEELFIPANKEDNLDELVNILKKKNA